MCLDILNTYRDLGLLILRIGIGFMFVLHGYPKITGGPEFWAQIGAATSFVGINFTPVFFGFMAALSEFGGGICLMLGLWFRPACLLMTITMAVAAAMHLGKGDDLVKGASHAVEMGFVFFSLFFIGPGLYSLDEKLKKTFRK